MAKASKNAKIVKMDAATPVVASDNINTPTASEVVAEAATEEETPQPSLAPPDETGSDEPADQTPAADVLPQVPGAPQPPEGGAGEGEGLVDELTDVAEAMALGATLDKIEAEKKVESVLELEPELKDLVARYKKNYPDAKYLLISSDHQIFLNTNIAEAKAHQAQLDAGKPLVKLDL